MLVFSLVLHEVAHGWAALRQGDDTGAAAGRLTLNPLPHLDPWLTVLMPALLWFGSGGTFTFGGARPMPVTTRKFREYRRGDLIVSSAGVVTNFGLALGFATLFALVGALGGVAPALAPSLDAAQRLCTWGIWLNLMLGVFNLIPIPPLDGSRILYHYLPPAWGLRYRQLEAYGFLPLLVLLLLARPLVAALLSPAAWGLQALLGVVLPFAIGDGWDIFRRS